MATVEAGMWLQIKCVNSFGITFDHDAIVVKVKDPSDAAKITVVYWGVGESRTSADRVISRITLEDFLKLGNNARIVAEPPSFTPEKVVARANSMIGRSDYHLLGKNCHWCYHGTAFSRQVFQAGVFGTVFGLSVAFVGIVAMSLGRGAAC